ncbi:hypothetical protein ACJJIF_02880 [Microbulbifer sp. SSSA002]|uniref:hypothetical protein n=1 Tax=Microbulbifer sp. SSSA002 TaxID=3243376 RepID=UPI00403A5879
MSKFVIRGYHWGYNDETFYPCGSYIKTVFDSEDAARAEKIKLERAHWAEVNLGETYQFFDGDEELIDKVNGFVKEKLGFELFTDDDYRDIFVPSALNDDDFAEFLQIADLTAYKLTKFEDEARFYAIWFNEANEYLMEYDECSESLVFGASLDELKKESEKMLSYYFDEHPEILKGDINEITDSPSILKELLDKSAGLTYDTQEKCISINTSRESDLFALNELLKKPAFTVKAMSVEELIKIQDELMQEYY